MALNHEFSVPDDEGEVRYTAKCDDLESVVIVEFFVPDDKRNFESCGSISIPVESIEAFAAELLAIKGAAEEASTNYDFAMVPA